MDYEERQKEICSNKDFYATKEEAEVAATYCYYQRGVKLKVYKCSVCEGYHLTSQVWD